jgi:hypothetical protein
LRGIIEDRSVLDTHSELVELMMTAIVPAGRRDDYYAVAVEPFTTAPFYEAPAWRQLGLTDPERFKDQLSVPADQFAFGRLMWAYEFILKEWAGVEANLRYNGGTCDLAGPARHRVLHGR